MNREELRRRIVEIKEQEFANRITHDVFLKRCLCHNKPASFPFGGWYHHCICKKLNREVPGYGLILRPGQNFSEVVFFNNNIRPKNKSAISRWRNNIKLELRDKRKNGKSYNYAN